MKYSKLVFIAVICALIAPTIVVPSSAHAQYPNWRDFSRQDMERYRDYWRSTDEGGDIDEDDVRQWRTRNSEIRDAIDDLDNDPVEDIFIPILFGVDLSDLLPNFGDPRDGGSRTHEGLDIMAADSTPIVSPTEAVVIRVGEGSSSGNYVTTANPGGESFVYMHLHEIADIEEGDELEVGDVIGYVGNTGNASGGPAHLHFEIREDREATDPLPRITRAFSLEEKMEFLEDALREYDDEEELAEILVEADLNTFIQAQASGVDLPQEIEELLPKIPVRDLTLGSEGTDVAQLQSTLIALGYLDIATPTGYFGALTQSALAAYQRVEGITPASGYYGPITRTHFSGVDTSTSQTKAELIAELTRQLRALQAQLEALRSAY